MAKNYKGAGDKLTFTVTGSDVTSGSIHQEGDAIGVIEGDAAVGEEGVLNLVGIFEVDKLSTDAMDVGDDVYYDATNDRVQLTASTHQWCGKVAAAAAASTTKVEVRFSQQEKQ